MTTSAPEDSPAPARPGTWRSLSLAKSSSSSSRNKDNESEAWERHSVSKSEARSLAAKRNQPVVAIAGADKSLSDQALHSGNMSINYKYVDRVAIAYPPFILAKRSLVTG